MKMKKIAKTRSHQAGVLVVKRGRGGKMFSKAFKSFFIILVFFTGFVLLGSGVLAHQEHKPLEYEVDVNAIILPIFAVDSKGEPIYDLKKEEIELLVNNNPVEIFEFTAFQVEEQKRVTVEDGKIEVMKAEARINFIIFDAISNSQKGLKRAKEIALGIINESPSTDAFVILGCDPKTGFRYITGPETDKKKLGSAIKEVAKLAGQRYFSAWRNFRRMGGHNVLGGGSRSGTGSNDLDLDGGDIASWEYRAVLFDAAIRNAEAGRKEYRKEIRTFLHSLSQMKYALKTITQPKHVFLISGGIPSSSLGSHLVRYYKFMSESAKAINYGGSMLYMVNPVPPFNTSIPHSLKHMARESGGKYFGGSSLEKIVKQVKNSTRAYYELAFFPGQSTVEKLRIKLKCKRKGVTLHTVNYAEKGKPYKEMESLQKKLFALSVITGGSWSRIVGDVKKVKYKKTKASNIGSNSKRIRVPIPENIKDHHVDIFVVNLDPKTMKANIGIVNQVVNRELEVDVPVEKEKMQFFVIVEPAKTLCLYNQVK
ncbi:MAG: hypothetical protein JSV88_02560 [Candidatus Aminicenantes bacterium]|nr:MAG: hypothetical protein JSV88_02560 [Candidatus Aminicenantes bacterium]